MKRVFCLIAPAALLAFAACGESAEADSAVKGSGQASEEHGVTATDGDANAGGAAEESTGTGGAANGTDSAPAPGDPISVAAGAANVEALTGSAEIRANRCDRLVDYEVFDVTKGGGDAATNVSCAWTFDDGGTSHQCSGQYEFAAAGYHGGIVVVTDLDSGATATFETYRIPVYDPLTLTIETSVPQCGLSFSYAAVRSGGKAHGEYRAWLEPAENWDAPDYPPEREDTLRVKKGGTYTLKVNLEQEHASGPICQVTAETQVVVHGCDGAEPPPPPPPECPPDVEPFTH
jgi:hypothetical protein